MPDRKPLVSTLCLTSALALVLSVLGAPIPMSGFATVSTRPDYVCRDFTPAQPTTSLSAAMATDAVLQIKALPSEDEEQDRDHPLNNAGVSFLIPCSFRKVPEGQLTAPYSILSRYPLRL